MSVLDLVCSIWNSVILSIYCGLTIILCITCVSSQNVKIDVLTRSLLLIFSTLARQRTININLLSDLYYLVMVTYNLIALARKFLPWFHNGVRKHTQNYTKTVCLVGNIFRKSRSKSSNTQCVVFLIMSDGTSIIKDSYCIPYEINTRNICLQNS